MSIFYDPQKRKTRIWVSIFFVLIPISIVVALFVIGGNLPDQPESDVENTRLR